MPWQFVPARRTRSRRSRAGASYEDRWENGDNPYADYDDDPYDDREADDYGDPEDNGDRPRRRRTRRRDDTNGFDGFYDRDGNPIHLTIQAPSDMLPPRAPAHLDQGWAPLRRRARF